MYIRNTTSRRQQQQHRIMHSNRGGRSSLAAWLCTGVASSWIVPRITMLAQAERAILGERRAIRAGTLHRKAAQCGLGECTTTPHWAKQSPRLHEGNAYQRSGGTFSQRRMRCIALFVLKEGGPRDCDAHLVDEAPESPGIT
jgi:hypothetical protein